MRTDADFVEFFQEAELRLRRALSAAYGPDRGFAFLPDGQLEGSIRASLR